MSMSSPPGQPLEHLWQEKHSLPPSSPIPAIGSAADEGVGWALSGWPVMARRLGSDVHQRYRAAGAPLHAGRVWRHAAEVALQRDLGIGLSKDRLDGARRPPEGGHGVGRHA